MKYTSWGRPAPTRMLDRTCLLQSSSDEAIASEER
jgi:hypothetical protein